MRRLYLAAFGVHDATEAVFKAALGAGAEPREILYLAPSPRKLRDTQLRLARLLGRRAFIPPAFATPAQLARDLHRRAGTARRFPAELRTLLVQSLLADRRPHPTIGYCAALADFIADVKAYSDLDQPTLVARLNAELAGFETPRARALEAAEVLRRYDEALRDRNWADETDVMIAGAGLAARLAPARVLILDSFVAPSRPEQTLLAALIADAESVFALGYDPDADSPDYRLAARFRDFVVRQSGFETVRLEAPARPAPPLFAYHSDEDEIAGICRHILKHLGRELDGTVLTFPRLGDYAPLVRRIFPQFGIPFTIYPDERLRTAAPVNAVLELLSAVSSDFPRLATAAALGSPFLAGLLRLGPEDAGFLPAAAAVNHYSKRARIIKGLRNWHHLSQRLAAAEGGDPDEPEAALVRDLEARIRSALRLLSGAFSRAGSLGALALSLKELLGRIGFAAAAEPDPDQGRFYDLLDALVAFERDFGAIPARLPELRRTLEQLCGTAAVTRDPDPAGVLVAGMAETLGLSPRHVVFGGLTEASLPGRYSADPLLPDRTRAALGMPDMTWHRDWQRFHLRRNVESASGTTFLSFPETSDSAPVLPTPYLESKPTPALRDDTPHCPRELQIAQGRLSRVRLAGSEPPVDFADDPGVRTALGRRFGPDREIAVTALEAYRRCPFQFYLERVLGLAPIEEPRFDVDARQWGLVAHRVLERLYAEGPVPIEELAAAAGRALDATLAETDLPEFWVQVMRRVFANLLPGFIACERELRAGGYSPRRIESWLRGEPAPGLKVKGRLDRLDAGPAGVRVLDYKTGAVSGITPTAVVKDRTHLQLPLYSRLLEDQGPVENLGVYSLREPRVIWLADRPYPVAELVAAAVEAAQEAAAGIRAGRFPPRPADDNCRNCELGHTCGMHQDTGHRIPDTGYRHSTLDT